MLAGGRINWQLDCMGAASSKKHRYARWTITGSLSRGFGKGRSPAKPGGPPKVSSPVPKRRSSFHVPWSEHRTPCTWAWKGCSSAQSGASLLVREGISEPGCWEMNWGIPLKETSPGMVYRDHMFESLAHRTSKQGKGSLLHKTGAPALRVRRLCASGH